jgi:hypothetical protein
MARSAQGAGAVAEPDDTHAVQWLLEPAAKALALAELSTRLPALMSDARWVACLPEFITSEAYQVVTLPADEGHAQAIGLVTVGEQPLAESALLLVEALWVADERAEAACTWAAAVMAKAAAMDVEGLILAAAGPDAPEAAEAPGVAALVAAGSVAGHPVLVEPVPLRYTVAGLFTAFSTAPTTTTLLTPRCVYLCNRNRLGALAGLPNNDAEAFFRGEGRLAMSPWWDCADLRELAAHFKARGFPTRAAGAFDGGVQAQLLQQGYVNQGTASMSRSFEVAAYYATNGGTQPGVVFRIDAATLRARGPVFDAWLTLLAHSEVMMGHDDVLTFATIVRALGPLDAGRCLAHWDGVAHTLAHQRGGMLREGAEFSVRDYVEPALAERLEAARIDAAATQRLLRALESHAMRSVTPFAMARTIDVLPDGRTRDVPLRHGYAVAFGLALPALRAALAGQQGDHRQPGWDLTAFGYMAKTCRDQEVFSTGPIPGHAIVDAVLVQADGSRA